MDTHIPIRLYMSIYIDPYVYILHYIRIHRVWAIAHIPFVWAIIQIHVAWAIVHIPLISAIVRMPYVWAIVRSPVA